MLPKILIRLSILALCFTAIPAYADWFNLEKVNFLKWTIDGFIFIVQSLASSAILFLKNNWGKIIITIISIIVLHMIYLTTKNK